MFELLFGWRKASKCKKLIKRVQCRLKLLKIKRYSIVRQLRDDVGQLINGGYEDIAFNRAEQLLKDESTMQVYELLDHFCEFIKLQLPYIRKHKDIPNDINEAISSLIYASARRGDLPELPALRKLFEERYGQGFAKAAVDLCPGNLVSNEIKEKLSIESVPDDLKHRLLDEIARDYSMKPEILTLEYTSEWKQQVNGNGEQEILDKDVSVCYRKTESSQREINVDSSSVSQNLQNRSCQSSPNSDMISTSVSGSIVQQSSPDSVVSPVYANSKTVEFSSNGNLGTDTCRSTLQERKEEGKTAASSSESLPWLPDETIVYLDDIEEVQSAISKDGSCQDKRLFKFKQDVQPKNENLDQSYIEQHYESLNTSSSIGSSRRSRRESVKRPKRRSVSQENCSLKDIGYLVYYEKPCRSSPTDQHRPRYQGKLQKKSETNKLYHVRNEERKHCCVESCKYQHDLEISCCSHHELENCSLDNPRYLCPGDERNQRENIPWKSNRGITSTSVLEQECEFVSETEKKKTEWTALPQKPKRRSCEFVSSTYGIFTYADGQPKQCEKTKWEEEGFNSPGSQASCNRSCPKAASSSTDERRFPPYLRAATMPQERPKDGVVDNIIRSQSFPVQYPNHVHPKLPDYDDLADKFMALKNEHQKKKHH
ncbi:putative Regulator of Vps4 activity in the MVB pathway protein [Tripterygium wilfordii]|uniref:Putative Regulator of Vps4 activity in the MVB pathway protein n=1 Tax=Tripterygium wilfordii TaxID=458696 RepID=A0A7J7DIU5_TRIWF|nr:uncharacterized protein LOC120000307 [Tripterygium wilfordii]KAF5745976.1 putative Regulator of Vps4 activity in the MVB pathway protein [Tripterygium wilfordii]